MTEPLIPYTFVPGTKAKAQEVNANFLSLAEQVQNVQSSATSQVEELETSINAQIDEVEENIAQNYSEKNLANTGMITNTILEAPNGVISYEGGIITVKAGVKVLMPNGRSDDGKMQNVEYTTTEAVQKTFNNMANQSTTLFLNNDGTIDSISRGNIFYKNVTPSKTGENVRWYNTDENKWYKYNTTESEWNQIVTAPIAVADWNANSAVTSLTASRPLNLVKFSDLQNFYTIRGILPRDLDYVIARYQNGWSFYTLYKSGWVRQGGYITGNGAANVNFFYSLGAAGYHISVARVSGGGTTSNVPVWIRAIQPTYIQLYSSGETGKVWCTEGYTTIGEY